MWKAVSDVNRSSRIKCQLQKKWKSESHRTDKKQENFSSITLTRLHFVNCCQISLKGLGLSSHFKGWLLQSSILLDDVWKESFPLIKPCHKQQSLTCCLHSWNADLHVQIWSAMWCLPNFSLLYKIFCENNNNNIYIVYIKASRQEPSTK